MDIHQGIAEGTEQCRAAYHKFMKAKYPKEEPPAGEFGYFAPDDDIPDKGLFLKPEPEFFLKPRKELGIRTLTALFRKAKGKPQQSGWWLKVGPGWIFLGETPEAVHQLFTSLIPKLG